MAECLRYFWHFQDINNSLRVEFLGHLQYPEGPEHPLGRCTAAAVLQVQLPETLPAAASIQLPVEVTTQRITAPDVSCTIARFGDTVREIEHSISRVGLVLNHAEVLATSQPEVIFVPTLAILAACSGDSSADQVWRSIMPPAAFVPEDFWAASQRIQLRSAHELAQQLLSADIVAFSLGAGISQQSVQTTQDLCASLGLEPHPAANTCLPPSQLLLLIQRLANPASGLLHPACCNLCRIPDHSGLGSRRCL
jgi:hypothetical protein